MSKINQIEQKLKEIDATKFHKLMDSYLNKKYSYQIQSNGTTLGEDKPTKGTPDSCVSLDNGKYIFIEYTTQKTNLLNKFLDDLKKCFDESKTNIPINKIEKIILACNLDIKPKDIETLKSQCKEKNIDCTIFTNSMLSNDLNNHFPTIAKDFLNIELDTNQILDYEDFLKSYNSSKYTTSLNTAFKFRKDEISNFDNFLNTKQILFITGSAGIGKTKFALEECKKYAIKNQYTFKAILNKGINLFDDMKYHFSNGKYLILIDDINRVYEALEYIYNYFDYKIRNQKIKIVATVRDYAKTTVLDKVPETISKEIIELNPFSDEEIKSIIKDEYNITHFAFLDKIIEVSQGNPRLALMSAKVAKQTNNLGSIYDVTAIYDEYFKTVNKDISISENYNLLISIVIISFFRMVDKSNIEQMTLIEDSFDISLVDFWGEVEKLNNLELVDLYQNEVVKISDQILSMYLFYKIVFIDKKIDIWTILDKLFIQYQKKTVDILYPLLNTFNHSTIQEELRVPVNKLWDKCKDNEEDLLLVMQTFWFLKQTDILVYLDEQICDLQEEEYNLELVDFWGDDTNEDSDKILGILAVFNNDFGSITNAIKLIVKYCKKRPLKLSQIIKTITVSYGYSHKRLLNDYSKENKLVDLLWQLSSNGKDALITKLFIRISSYLIKTEFENNYSKGNQIIMSHYKLAETDKLENLRKSIFKKVFSLYEYQEYKNDIMKLIQEYPSGLSFHHSVSKVELWDSEHILGFIKSSFNKTSYEECVIARDFLNVLDDKNIKYDKQTRDIFRHKYFDIEEIIMLDCISISQESKNSTDTDWNNIDNILIERLTVFFKDYSFKDCENLFNVCDLIDKSKGRHNYKILNNLSNLFNIWSKNNPQLYRQIFDECLKSGNPLSLNLTIFNLIKTLGQNEAYKLLCKYDYINKDSFLFQYFNSLSKDQITNNEADELLSLYKKTKTIFSYHSLDYLKNYLPLKANILVDIVSIIFSKAKQENIQFIGLISDIFYPDTEIFKNLEIYFNQNIALLKSSYLLCCENEQHYDYNSIALNKILTLDNLFIQEYINYMFNRESPISHYDITNNFLKIWERDDYEAIFIKLIDTLFSIKENGRYIRGNTLKVFFNYKKNINIKEKVNNIIKKLIQKYSKNEKYIIFIFGLVAEYPQEKRQDFIRYFLEHNKSFDLFNKLPLKSFMSIFKGSRVPMLEKEKEYLESLLDIVSDISFLKHKQKIEKLIQYKKDDIKKEKKYDFMSDD